MFFILYCIFFFLEFGKNSFMLFLKNVSGGFFRDVFNLRVIIVRIFREDLKVKFKCN